MNVTGVFHCFLGKWGKGNDGALSGVFRAMLDRVPICSKVLKKPWIWKGPGVFPFRNVSFDRIELLCTDRNWLCQYFCIPHACDIHKVFVLDRKCTLVQKHPIALNGRYYAKANGTKADAFLISEYHNNTVLAEPSKQGHCKPSISSSLASIRTQDILDDARELHLLRSGWCANEKGV